MAGQEGAAGGGLFPGGEMERPDVSDYTKARTPPASVKAKQGAAKPAAFHNAPLKSSDEAEAEGQEGSEAKPGKPSKKRARSKWKPEAE